jgi:tripartite ATP-independent transporter DctM subunit
MSSEAQVKKESSAGMLPPSAKGIADAIAWLDKISPFTRWVAVAGMAVFVGMVLFTFTDVILRYVFNHPLDGSIEITEMLMIIVVFFGIGYAHLAKAHVSLDLVTVKLKPKAAVITESITNFLSIAVFIIVIWQTIMRAATTSETTIVQAIPIRPFAAMVPFGCLLLLIVILRDYLRNVFEGLRSGIRVWWLVLLPIVITAILVLIGIYRPISLELTVQGLIGIIVMLIVLFSNMPVGFLLIGCGLLFLAYARGTTAAFQVVGVSWYRTVATYSWSPIMFFLLMGFICFVSDLGKDLVDAANKWLGHFRGGLAMAAVVACTAFGAVVGDNLTGSLTVSSIALPEMRKYKYDDELSIGTLTCAGIIGALIPPSIPFIIYAVLSEQSVGELFIAGIIPGILCALVFIAAIYFRCLVKPEMGPPAARARWSERFISIKGAGPIALLFIIVIGGMYAGVFTATEGGAIGAFGSLVIALAMRRLNWKKFTNALAESAKLTAMSFTLLGGAMVFGYFMSISKLPYAMAEFVAGLNISSIFIMIIIVVIYFILGCFIPAIPMVLITVPIFLPIAKALNWDLIWFGVIVVMMFNMAAITPPFGINLFAMRGMTKAPTELIFRSVWIFVGALGALTLLIVFVPAIATWLPYLMH